MSIKTRLIFSFGLLVFLTCIVGAFAVYSASSILDMDNDFYIDSFLPVVELQRVNEDLLKIRINALQTVQSENINHKMYEYYMQAMVQDVEDIMTKYKSKYISDGEEDEQKALELWQVNWEKYKNGFVTSFQLASAGKLEEARTKVIYPVSSDNFSRNSGKFSRLPGDFSCHRRTECEH